VTALAVAIMVKVGMITSSPGSSPSVAMARCMATVPLAQAMPYWAPQKAAKRDSKSRIKLPAEEIQLVSTAWVTYFNSLPPSVGSQTGINFRSAGRPSNSGIERYWIFTSGSDAGMMAARSPISSSVSSAGCNIRASFGYRIFQRNGVKPAKTRREKRV
jgi:hypothetical protein